VRRFVAATLVCAMVLPMPASVGRAQEGIETPEISTPAVPTATASTRSPSTPVPTIPPQTAVPTATPKAAEPTPAPSRTPARSGTPAADDRRREPPATLAAACPRPDTVEPTSWQLDGNDAINNMHGSISDTFKSVETRDIGVTGQFVGFRPGSLYAHVYARDSATIAPAAQFFYDLVYLTRPVEEFLAMQYDGEPDDPEDARWKTPGQPGAVSGTIGGGEIAGAKMLLVSDEEPSVITMAYVATKAGAGPDWLQQDQNGKPRIQRLNEAMDWIFARRFDQETRAIKRGNTTDWGDVVVGQGHGSGEFVKEPTAWTLSIYDQAWTYRALHQLAELNQLVDRPEEAEHQIARANLLRQSVMERFWQGDRGYFRTRIPLPPLPREFDEDSIVSIANGVAVYAGITEPQERKLIFTALENARKAAGASKPGLTLWPPYPAGFFDYPQMVPGRYQNGAVWDWWGGMQISAELWTGYSGLGRRHLDMVARDWAREPGEIYEWQETATHANAGSPAYAGAAATMAEAIITGLFGVDLNAEGWAITPRLGSQNGEIHVFHPPSGCVLDYRQTYAGDTLALEWETSHPNPGTLRVLLPDNVRVDSALLDEKSVPVKLERLGDDVMAVLSAPAPAGQHRLELKLAESEE
jgi:hypothetical protein